MATLTLGRSNGVYLFEVIGAAFVVILAAFWLIATGRTLHGIYECHLFVAPCLSDGTGLRLLADKPANSPIVALGPAQTSA